MVSAINIDSCVSPHASCSNNESGPHTLLCSFQTATVIFERPDHRRAKRPTTSHKSNKLNDDTISSCAREIVSQDDAVLYKFTLFSPSGRCGF